MRLPDWITGRQVEETTAADVEKRILARQAEDKRIADEREDARLLREQKAKKLSEERRVKDAQSALAAEKKARLKAEAESRAAREEADNLADIAILAALKSILNPFRRGSAENRAGGIEEPAIDAVILEEEPPSPPRQLGDGRASQTKPVSAGKRTDRHPVDPKLVDRMGIRRDEQGKRQF